MSQLVQFTTQYLHLLKYHLVLHFITSIIRMSSSTTVSTHMIERKKENGRKSELLWDLNPRHSALYADALQTELRKLASRLMSIGCPYRHPGVSEKPYLNNNLSGSAMKLSATSADSVVIKA